MWKDILREFWEPFQELVQQTSDISITEVIDKLDPLIGRHIFPVKASIPEDSKTFLVWHIFWLFWLLSVSVNALVHCMLIGISGLHSVNVP